MSEIRVLDKLREYLRKNDGMFLSKRIDSVPALATALALVMGLPIEENLRALLPQQFEALEYLPIYDKDSPEKLVGLMPRPRLLAAKNATTVTELNAAFWVLKEHSGQGKSLNEVFPGGKLPNGALSLLRTLGVYVNHPKRQDSSFSVVGRWTTIDELTETDLKLAFIKRMLEKQGQSEVSHKRYVCVLAAWCQMPLSARLVNPIEPRCTKKLTSAGFVGTEPEASEDGSAETASPLQPKPETPAPTESLPKTEPVQPSAEPASTELGALNRTEQAISKMLDDLEKAQSESNRLAGDNALLNRALQDATDKLEAKQDEIVRLTAQRDALEARVAQLESEARQRVQGSGISETLAARLRAHGINLE